MKNRLLNIFTSASALLLAFGAMVAPASAAGADQTTPSATGSSIAFENPFSFNPLWIPLIFCGSVLIISIIVALVKHIQYRRKEK